MTELNESLQGTFPKVIDYGTINSDTAMMLNLEENLEFLIMEKLGSSLFTVMSKCGGFPFTKAEILRMGIELISDI